MANSLLTAIQSIARHEALSEDALEGAFEALFSGDAAPELIAAFLTGLAVRGETSTELVAGAKIMRAHAMRHEIAGPLIDTCGTGGLPWKSLNTSTASAIIVAAAGGRVAKHGNRSVPPKTGSADVLEALGVNLEIDADTFRSCIDGAGVGFLFARTHHSAMRHVAPVRAALGIRTVFNLLGPLTNPAGASHQILGVYDEHWLRPMAEALAALGTQKAWVVHGVDGIDEISIAGVTKVAAVEDGEVRTFDITPSDAGFRTSPLSSLEGLDVTGNARAIEELLNGQEGPFRDVVCLNAGAALYLLDVENSLKDGARRAATAIDTGAARETLTKLVNLSHGRES
ncbi:MAG: anthranilate phosphoribosyltransferase [Pseudomonadota bacterium]